MVGGRACGDNITAKRSNLLKDAVSVCLCACDTVLCTVKLHNANSFHCVGLCSPRWLNTNVKTVLYIILRLMPISLWVGWVGGVRGGQFSDRCLYTTYRCRRNSEWLPWRLTTTHRSRQGNRKNIINKGTNFPSNKRSLNAPLPILKKT